MSAFRAFTIILLFFPQLPLMAVPPTLGAFVNAHSRSLKPLELISKGSIITGEFNSIEWQAKQATPSKWVHRLKFTNLSRVKNCDIAYLFVTGGRLDEQSPQNVDYLLNDVTDQTGCWAASIDLIPNQGLTFVGQQNKKFEDEIIAYGFSKFMDTGDPNWLVNFAMVNSVKLGMNELEAYYLKESKKKKLRGFIVSGESKRAWTSWLVAAVDTRVKGIIPLVIDFLNSLPSLKHHFDRYGFWAPALNDYTEKKIFTNLDASSIKALMSHVDPYSYRERLTMPKLVINSANDQFFVPDSSQFYFDQLKGTKYLRYVSNVGHHINERKTEYWPTVIEFIKSINLEKTMPKCTWERNKRIVNANCDSKPKQIYLNRAFNAKVPDFRYGKDFPAYKRALVSMKMNQVRLPELDEQGWYAEFLEFCFERNIKLTTQVYVEKR